MNNFFIYLLQLAEDAAGFAEKCHNLQTSSETSQNVIVALKAIQTF